MFDPDICRSLLFVPAGNERYLRSGSARDRELLLRAGYTPPDRSGLGWWQ